METSKLLNIIGIVLIAGFVLFAAKNFWDRQLPDVGSVLNEEELVDGSAEVQVVTLSMKDYNYDPQVIRLKQNVPAQIVVDMNKVQGCLRSIVIPEYGVRKVVRPGDNVISFTPKKKGTFSFSCSMGMGFGKIVVA